MVLTCCCSRFATVSANPFVSTYVRSVEHATSSCPAPEKEARRKSWRMAAACDVGTPKQQVETLDTTEIEPPPQQPKTSRCTLPTHTRISVGRACDVVLPRAEKERRKEGEGEGGGGGAALVWRLTLPHHKQGERKSQQNTDPSPTSPEIRGE